MGRGIVHVEPVVVSERVHAVRGQSRDSGNGGFDNGRKKGGGQDVLKDNVLSKIVSKMLVDKGILGVCWEEILLLVVAVLGFVGGDVGKGFEAIGRSQRDGGTGDNIGRRVRDIEEGIVLDVVKGRPDELWRG